MRILINRDSGYGLNKYLYVTGGDPKHTLTPERFGNFDNRLMDANPLLPTPLLTISRAKMSRAPVIEKFPWGTRVTVHSQAPNTPDIETAITLSDEQKVIEIQNSVVKNSVLSKEAVYFAFPFFVEQPNLEYQGATAWINPERDLLPGANRQWFTTQGGVVLRGTNGDIGWASVDAPVITLQDINRGLWPQSIKISNGTVFSYAMNNYWYTDTPARQGGTFTFRYQITSGRRLDAVTMSSFAARARTPLFPIAHAHKEWQQLLPEGGVGFLSASLGTQILTVKPLESSTYLLRIQNTSGKQTESVLTLPLFEIDRANLASVLGVPGAPIERSAHEIRLPLGANAIASVVVRIRADARTPVHR